MANVPKKQLKELVAKLGTRRAAAKAIGCDSSNLTKWLNGSTGITKGNRANVLSVHERIFAPPKPKRKAPTSSLAIGLLKAAEAAEGLEGIRGAISRIEGKLNEGGRLNDLSAGVQAQVSHLSRIEGKVDRLEVKINAMLDAWGVEG